MLYFIILLCLTPNDFTCQGESAGSQTRENIATFKALIGNSPAYLTKLFNRCSNEKYNLRSNFDQLSLAKPSTNFLKKSFSYRAAKSCK